MAGFQESLFENPCLSMLGNLTFKKGIYRVNVSSPIRGKIADSKLLFLLSYASNFKPSIDIRNSKVSHTNIFVGKWLRYFLSQILRLVCLTWQT